MMEQVASVSAWALLVVGSFFLVTGALGMVRLPDVFTRMHAAGMTDTMGAGLVLAGLCIHSGFTPATVRLVLILAFLWFTCPVATHALARAALAGGVEPYSLPDAEGGSEPGSEGGDRGR
ncbi:MAG: monovalent cation/H(+) antiporter subunit G [Gemmatimonadetes bacterium]|nr:monovalent cation/H(+) antiporter subunit G [Gemmatimonadota bacterium]MCY3944091.1 monovalent cation/H(+) antiporter subunit G [Gemmatimonadota bacterium]